jgi:hypothetical protein
MCYHLVARSRLHNRLLRHGQSREYGLGGTSLEDPLTPIGVKMISSQKDLEYLACIWILAIQVALMLKMNGVGFLPKASSGAML